MIVSPLGQANLSLVGGDVSFRSGASAMTIDGSPLRLDVSSLNLSGGSVVGTSSPEGGIGGAIQPRRDLSRMLKWRRSPSPRAPPAAPRAASAQRAPSPPPAAAARSSLLASHGASAPVASAPVASAPVASAPASTISASADGSGSGGETAETESLPEEPPPRRRLWSKHAAPEFGPPLLAPVASQPAADASEPTQIVSSRSAGCTCVPGRVKAARSRAAAAPPPPRRRRPR